MTSYQYRNCFAVIILVVQNIHHWHMFLVASLFTKHYLSPVFSGGSMVDGIRDWAKNSLGMQDLRKNHMVYRNGNVLGIGISLKKISGIQDLGKKSSGIREWYHLRNFGGLIFWAHGKLHKLPRLFFPGCRQVAQLPPTYFLGPRLVAQTAGIVSSGPSAGCATPKDLFSGSMARFRHTLTTPENCLRPFKQGSDTVLWSLKLFMTA